MLTPITLTSSAAWSQPSGLLKTLLSRPQFPHLKITSRASSGLWDGGRGVFTLQRLFLYLSTSFHMGPSGLMAPAVWGEEQEPFFSILQMETEAQCGAACQSQQEGTGWSHKPGPADSVPWPVLWICALSPPIPWPTCL